MSTSVVPRPATGPALAHCPRVLLLVLLAGVGVLLSVAPAGAAVLPPVPVGGPDPQARALNLLDDAARAASSRSYQGTSYVGTWQGSASASAVVQVAHVPGSSSALEVLPEGDASTAGLAVPSVAPDARLLGLLAEHYALTVARAASCVGRPVQVVEAGRADGSVAGRFWVDDASGLVLRREVYDEQGRRLRSSAFVDLEVDPVPLSGTATTAPVSSPTAGGAFEPDPDAAADLAAGPRLAPQQLDRLRDQGWDVPAQLPGGFDLYDARMPSHDGAGVLHLSYSDGLSTLSLFAQRGNVQGMPADGFAEREVSGVQVWLAAGSPERAVWSGNGQAFTVVSDAPRPALAAVVAVLPHEDPPATGPLARVRRGLARLASWVNPFS